MGRTAPCSSRRRFHPPKDERGTSESRRGNNANFSDNSDNSDDSDPAPPGCAVASNAHYKGGHERSGKTLLFQAGRGWFPPHFSLPFHRPTGSPEVPPGLLPPFVRIVRKVRRVRIVLTATPPFRRPSGAVPALFPATPPSHRFSGASPALSPPFHRDAGGLIPPSFLQAFSGNLPEEVLPEKVLFR